MAEWMPENPAPDLFTTFERVELCHRVEVTLENIHLLAKHFECTVDYSYQKPRLIGASITDADVGSWIDCRGSRWNPEPLSQGWSPAGTFTDRTIGDQR